MKVALVTLQQIVNSFGGSTKVFFNMANNLSRRGYDVTAIACDPNKGEPIYKISDTVVLRNCTGSFYLKYVLAPLSKFISSFARDRKSRRSRRKIFELKAKAPYIKASLDATQPDVIISYQQETTYLLKEILGVENPIITMIHRDPLEYFSKPEFPIYKNALNQSRFIQVLLPSQISTASQFVDPSKLVCIPNVVPQYNHIAHLDNSLILNVSRVGTNKRQHLIVEAFELIKNKYPQWNVDFWGLADSDYAQTLKKFIESHNLQSRVRLRGESTDIASILRNAGIFVFSSAVEGFSLALTEAMSMGLPVIACRDCASARALICDKQTGLLCDSTAVDIAEKIELLINNKELSKKLGENAKEHMKDFSADKIWNLWEKLILEATDQKGKLNKLNK